MKDRLCRLCGRWYKPERPYQHTCGCEDNDEAVHDELAMKRLQEPEPDSTVEGTTKAFAEIMRLLPEPEDLTMTRAVERELSDPALKVRLAAALAKRLEEP